MSAFPTYDEKRIAALDGAESAILGVLGKRGYARQEPSVLQPAEIFLDRSGEEIRRRTFTLTDPAGNELCLRPDLTIPICKNFLDTKAKLPARLCYHGLAFRFQPAEPNRPTQFYQAGAELLGIADRPEAETEILSLTVEAARATGLRDFTVKLGDLSLFSAFVDALDIPPQWRMRLKRHFWRSGYFEALLARLSGKGSTGTQKLLAHLGTLSESEARPAFEGLMEMIGNTPLGGRSREEIIDRLIEQAADAAALKLDPWIAKSLAKLLAISGPAAQSIEKIRTLAKSAGVSLEAPLKAMTARIATLKSLGVDQKHISFAARFGRNMEYYTGFVFELWSRDAEGAVQIAGGGRYDTLMEQLGSKKHIPAIGCAIRTERVLAAIAAQKAKR
ncbi:MAG: ATP phosphoribosyltransferase regulatory subunit [Proteobacteria bacterium]|nr:ATP phosphoribosyltransferase regulatory subunit [Pseudomonadota bacterium]